MVLCFQQRWEVYMKCVLVKTKESVALMKNVSVYENWNFVGNTHREITDLTHFLKASAGSNSVLHFLDDVLKDEIQVNRKSFLFKN